MVTDDRAIRDGSFHYGNTMMTFFGRGDVRDSDFDHQGRLS